MLCFLFWFLWNIIQMLHVYLSWFIKKANHSLISCTFVGLFKKNLAKNNLFFKNCIFLITHIKIQEHLFPDALPRDTPTTSLQLSDTTGEFLSMPTFSHDDGTGKNSGNLLFRHFMHDHQVWVQNSSQIRFVGV